MRVAAHGKSFLLDGSPFRFWGVTLTGPADEIRPTLGTVASAGYTVVSLPAHAQVTVDEAMASGLRFMLEFDEANLAGLAEASRFERRRRVRDATTRLRRLVGPWAGSDALLGVVVRDQVGGSGAATALSRRTADELAMASHEEDTSLLAAWRGRWPLKDECPAEFDFLIADLERSTPSQLASALMACHCEVGDRPLVLGGGAQADADPSWVIETAVKCGAGGIVAGTWSPPKATGGDSPLAHVHPPAVCDLDFDWPSISVVVNTHNAEATLDECLSHCERLEYPDLELIVVDDGSTDATRRIASSHANTKLISIPRSGLSTARNVGYESARGNLIVYLDADAYPSPEWLRYIAIAACGDRVGGVGGPNVPPPGEPASARVVARSPGGPVPQLLTPDRAAHVPGCNMAFWRSVLEQLHGFDPAVEGGGDDIAFQRRFREAGHEIAYHPAALVWHHRRPGLGAYLRQQCRDGFGQALLERRYPEWYPAGYRLWKRHRWRSTETDRAPLCPVKYLTLPRMESPLLERAHQWGVPVAVLLVLTAPLGLLRRKFAAPAAGATAFLGALFAIDVALAGVGRRRSERALSLTLRVAGFRVLRPVAFRWGHLTGRRRLARSPAPLASVRGEQSAAADPPREHLIEAGP